MDWLSDLGNRTGTALLDVGSAVGDGAKWTENSVKSVLPQEVVHPPTLQMREVSFSKHHSFFFQGGS
jgi:hypothetical protein